MNQRRAFLAALTCCLGAARGVIACPVPELPWPQRQIGVRILQRLGKHTSHSYFDLCPESPSGQWVLGFEFANRVPGNGRAVVFGANEQAGRVYGAEYPVFGLSHNAAGQFWLDDNYYLVCDQKAKATLIFQREGKLTSKYDLAILDLDGDIKAGIVCSPQSFPINDHRRRAVAVFRFQLLTQKTELLFDLTQALELLPPELREFPQSMMWFDHPKISKNGDSFLVVLKADRSNGSPQPTGWKNALFVWSIGDSQLRFVSFLGHHPAWCSEVNQIEWLDDDEHGRQHLYVATIDKEISISSFDLVVRGVHGSLDRGSQKLLIDRFNSPKPGYASINILDIDSGCDQMLATTSNPAFDHKSGMHPHPVWSRDFRKVYFNGISRSARAIVCIDV